MQIIEYSEVYKCNIEFNTNEWILMEKMSELLGLFYSITKQMSHRYANSGDILPHIQVLRKYVTDEVTKFRLNKLYAMLASLYDSFEGCFLHIKIISIVYMLHTLTHAINIPFLKRKK